MTPVRSRLFVLTVHSEFEIDLNVRDSLQTDLDQRVALLILEKFGIEDKNSRSGYRLLYTFSDKVYGFSYAIQNTKKSGQITVILDCSNSENMLFSSTSSVMEREIEPLETEFFFHTIAMPSESKFKRVAKCEVLQN